MLFFFVTLLTPALGHLFTWGREHGIYTHPCVEYRNAGINRLSIGVQSFNDKQLKFLGRIHSASEAQNAIVEAQNVGFENLNIDLMYGLKGQSIDECMNDITTAITLNPSHISFHQLTLEPNTLFSKFPPSLPSDDYMLTDGMVKTLKGSA